MGKEIAIQSITFVFAKLIHTCFCIYFFLTRYVLTMKNELKCMLSKNSNEVVGHYKESHALHDGINGWAFVEKKPQTNVHYVNTLDEKYHKCSPIYFVSFSSKAKENSFHGTKRFFLFQEFYFHVKHLHERC